jgi:predicted ArsR family transcriptional regulator
MSERSVKSGSLAGTRGRIIDLIRRSRSTATEIAEQLELTYNAVRVHLAVLERDGLIRKAGLRRGETRPSSTYELAEGVDDALSRAYMPFASHLMRALGDRLTDQELTELMRDVGRRLAADWSRPRGPLSQRVDEASALLQELGAPNEVERAEDALRIRGFGCLLAAAVHGQPHVCRAMETLLGELVGTPVRECCERGAQPRCCFEISSEPAAAPARESDDLTTETSS